MVLAENLIDKETKTAVINIEFSQMADILAVSYDNSRSSKEYENKLEK